MLQRRREFPTRIRRTFARLFRQRKHLRLGNLHHRPLRLHIESPDRFDLVAEKFDAQRPRAFRRKHVENASADRIFPHHLHRIALLISDRLQVRLDHVERQLLAHPQLEREPSVVFRPMRSQQRRSSRSDGHRHRARSPSATARWRAAPRFRCAAIASVPAARQAPESTADVPRRRARNQQVEKCFRQLE